MLANQQATYAKVDVQGKGMVMQPLEGWVESVQGPLLVGFEIMRDGFHLGLLTLCCHYKNLKGSLLPEVLPPHMLAG